MGFSHKVDVVHWYCLKKALGSKGKKGLLKTVKKWCDSPNAGAYAVDLENNTAYRLAK
uniref:Uncharacterized protein n=1 Tax=viral metagenome TaxID=1070528 RepID=A0A6M3X6D8_9ZZZZ